MCIVCAVCVVSLFVHKLKMVWLRELMDGEDLQFQFLSIGAETDSSTECNTIHLLVETVIAKDQAQILFLKGVCAACVSFSEFRSIVA